MDLLIKQPVFHLSPDCDMDAPVYISRTPVGTFRYGTDNTGVSYWQDDASLSLGKDVKDMDTARECAEAAYFEAVKVHPVYKLITT